jgi:hypothetical protein
MGLVLVTTFGLIVWIILWAIGAEGLDAFVVSAVIILIGATSKLLAPYLPGRE